MVFGDWSDLIFGEIPEVGLTLKEFEYLVLVLDQDKDSHASLEVAAMEQEFVLSDLMGHQLLTL